MPPPISPQPSPTAAHDVAVAQNYGGRVLFIDDDKGYLELVPELLKFQCSKAMVDSHLIEVASGVPEGTVHPAILQTVGLIKSLIDQSSGVPGLVVVSDFHINTTGNQLAFTGLDIWKALRESATPEQLGKVSFGVMSGEASPDEHRRNEQEGILSGQKAATNPIENLRFVGRLINHASETSSAQ